MKRVLDIGCGKDKHRIEGTKVIGVDVDPDSDADVIHDLNRIPWPFDDDEFDEAICQDILEHLDNILPVMQEINRISRQGSTVKIRTPHYSSYYAYDDPTHKHRFGYYTFDRFGGMGFMVIEKRIIFPRIWRVSGLSAFFNRFPRRWEQLFAFIIRAENMYIELENIKCSDSVFADYEEGRKNK